jgi:hypothetical protein
VIGEMPHQRRPIKPVLVPTTIRSRYRARPRKAIRWTVGSMCVVLLLFSMRWGCDRSVAQAGNVPVQASGLTGAR